MVVEQEDGILLVQMVLPILEVEVVELRSFNQVLLLVEMVEKELLY